MVSIVSVLGHLIPFVFECRRKPIYKKGLCRFVCFIALHSDIKTIFDQMVAFSWNLKLC